MFTAFPSYDRYRTLRLADPLLRGEDVFALQTALEFIGNKPGAVDGVFGPATDRAVRAAQAFYEIVVDGLAGGTTQTWLCRSLAAHVSAKYNLPKGLLIGQITHESGCRVGNYSPQRADGSYDAGVAQRNTAHTPAKDGFNMPLSVDALGVNERKYYDKYAGVKDVRRRWMLAAGAWNAPAYASFIANEEGAHVPKNETAIVGPTARFTLERYMTAATLLLEL